MDLGMFVVTSTTPLLAGAVSCELLLVTVQTRAAFVLFTQNKAEKTQNVEQSPGDTAVSSWSDGFWFVWLSLIFLPVEDGKWWTKVLDYVANTRGHNNKAILVSRRHGAPDRLTHTSERGLKKNVRLKLNHVSDSDTAHLRSQEEKKKLVSA